MHDDKEDKSEPPRDSVHFFFREKDRCQAIMAKYGVRADDRDDLWSSLVEKVVSRDLISKYEKSRGAWSTFIHKVTKNHVFSFFSLRTNKQRECETSVYYKTDESGKMEPIQIKSSDNVERTVLNKVLLRDFEEYLSRYERPDCNRHLVEDASGDYIEISESPKGVLKMLSMGNPMVEIAETFGITQPLATHRRKSLAKLAKKFGLGIDS